MSRSVSNVIILGAAGRDFHDFNTYWRDHEGYRVVAFTAAQIPNIDGRTYPPELSGPRYPKGVPILEEERVADLIREHDVDLVSMAYSDLPHEEVMHKGALVNAAGADFIMLGARHTMLKSTKPVIAVCAVRTGCGKSQTTRYVAEILKSKGKRVAAVRHPMPYGDLSKQICQRYETLADLDKYECTIEEREEYEPHIVSGTLCFAGVDYERILRQAEQDADVILWDGGNNDTPFYKPDLLLVVTDPHRAGHGTHYYPGETNLRMADVVVVNKVDTANQDDIEKVLATCRSVNPRAAIVQARSPVRLEGTDGIAGKSVLVVEDGPTVTHGGMPYGAGHVAARQFGAASIVDPRPASIGSIRETFANYPHLTEVLPAMGYGREQIDELEQTINAVDCGAVLIGTPIDLGRMLTLNKPSVRVRYGLEEVTKGQIEEHVLRVL
ncbi:MAG: cyclic 2,3-diphosphoglycerate synthase [Planctomycetota bacterium]